MSEPQAVAPQPQNTGAEIDLGAPPRGSGNNPLSPVHAAFFGAPAFSPIGRASGLSALEVDRPSYPHIPISKISARVTWIETYRHMLETLGVSVQAAYGGSGVKASAAVQFVRSLEIQESSAYFLLSARVESDPVRLTTAPKMRQDLYPQDDASRRMFYKSFGDGWVSDITLGGGIYALFEVETYSRSEREELRARLEVVSSSGGIQAGFRKAFSEIVGKRSIKVTYIQEGGKEVLRGIEGLAGVDQVLAALQGIWDTVREEPVIIRWTASPYEAVDGIPRPSQFLAVERYQRAVEQAARQHAIARERLAALRFAKAYQDRFIDFDQPIVENWITGLEQYVKELEKLTAELDAVEIPESELDERLAQMDRDPRLPSAQAMPREHPLFELFAVPLGREAFQTARDFERPGTNRRRHLELLTPTRLDIAPDHRSIRYEYRLDVINRQRRSNGRWKESDRRSFSVNGYVLTEFDVEQTAPNKATIRIREVDDVQRTKFEYLTHNFGGDPLIAVSRAKNGAVIDWTTEM